MHTDSPLLTTQAKLWLLIMLLAVSAAQFAIIPPWLVAMVCALLALGVGQALGKVPLLPRWLRVTLVLGMMLALLLFSPLKQLAGLATLLLAGAMMKVLELQRRRDGWVLVLVACFICAVNFLFHQSLLAALYGSFSLALILAALIAMHQGEYVQQSLQPLAKSLVVLLQSLPLMLVLFLLFPRIGPLWSVQFNQPVAQTGLSDSLQPGQVSELVRSSAVAFRARFESGQLPPPSQRYWRTLTFSTLDESGWQADEHPRSAPLQPSQPAQWHYDIIAEPSARPWLSLLDYPVSTTAKGFWLADGNYRLNQPLLERLRYTGQALSQAPYQPLTERQRYLQLPATGNPQTRALVAQWQRQGLAGAALVEHLLAWYRRAFSYTLSPGRSEGDVVDAFLFQSQQGFCEHFAHASVYVLRLAGIPARLVGGYLGGEWNPYEQYLQIRQADAHAWVEVWQEGVGWQRLDPTAAVAPERIEQPIDQLFADDPLLRSGPVDAVINLQRHLPWLAQWRLRYEAFNYQWHRWVLGYHQQQGQLLKDWLGALSAWKVLLLLVPVAMGLGGVTLWLLRQPNRLHPLDQDWLRISRQLSRYNPELARRSGETTTAYGARITRSCPALLLALHHWIGCYQQARYGKQAPAPGVYQRATRQLLAAITAQRRNLSRVAAKG